jgi:hypothetical protein
MKKSHIHLKSPGIYLQSFYYTKIIVCLEIVEEKQFMRIFYLLQTTRILSLMYNR